MPKPSPLVITHFLLLLLLSFLLSSNNALTHQHHVFREAPQFYNSRSCPSIQYPPNNRTSPVHKEEEEEEKGAKGVSDDICSDQAVHVAMTLDATYLRGSIAAVHSILQHSSCPENVNFHFITAATYADHGGAALSNSFPYLRFRIYPFRAAAAVSRLISASIRTALNCPLNYARSYLADTLPACVRRVVYLDSDLILVDDVSKLAATPLGPAAVLAAPEYCNANFSSYFTDSFWSHPSLPLTFAGRRACYFNTGVMVMDLARWRAGGFTARIEEWMEVQKRTRIYQLGSLPPFLLVFAGNIGTVDHRWNQHGLGGDNFRGLCRNLHAGPVSLLHWSGKGKPWARLDANRPCPLDALWAPYDLLRTPFALDS